MRAGNNARSQANFSCFMAHSSVPWTTQAGPCLSSRCSSNFAVISTTVDLSPMLLLLGGKSTDEVSSASYNARVVGVGAGVILRPGAFRVPFYDRRQRLLTVGEEYSAKYTPALAQPHTYT